MEAISPTGADTPAGKSPVEIRVLDQGLGKYRACHFST